MCKSWLINQKKKSDKKHFLNCNFVQLFKSFQTPPPQKILESYPWDLLVIAMVFMDIVCIFFEILHQTDSLNPAKHGLHSLLDVLLVVSFTILGVFTVEILVKIFVFGSHFWKHFWHIFDFCVVSVFFIYLKNNFSMFVTNKILHRIKIQKIQPNQTKNTHRSASPGS